MTEKALVEKAKARDAEAISTLYDNNIKAIYRFVLYKTNHKEIAEDITSEVFVRAFEKIEKFKGNSSFKTWLYTIARNLVIEWYRNKNKTTELIYEPEGTQDLESEVQEAIDNENVGNPAMRGSENETLLNNILNQISNERYKTVLELRFLLRYTIKETAAELKITEGNVKVIQNRALKKARGIALLFEQRREILDSPGKPDSLKE